MPRCFWPRSRKLGAWRRAAPPSCAATMPSSGRPCAREQRPMIELSGHTPGQTAADIALDERQTRPKNVGARIRRTEDARLLTGHASFVDDRQVKGMLHIAFRRSDHAHARIASIDTSAARTVPGVAAVLTAEDVADAAVALRAVSRMAA